MKDLKDIKSPADIRQCTVPELESLAKQIRETIIGQVAKHGGHLASSLGVVELTLALHYVFDTPDDKLVWDVGHQAYVHKLITGRYERFGTLRQQGGISGFLKRNESEYDCFGAGHASTSISAALGFAAARNQLGRKNNVVAIIGDGSMTGGMAYEAINNVGISKHNMTIILNDNKMSIAPNVGGFSKYLNRIISDPVYNKMRSDLDRLMTRLPGVLGSRFRDLFLQAEKAAKVVVKPGRFFEDLGVRYFGPIDGHDINELIMLLQRVKNQPGPCLVHILTEKGRGLDAAVKDPTKWHGTGPFDPESGLPITPGNLNPSLTSVFGKTLLELARKDERIMGITAAMPTGCGMDIVAKELPDRVVDVGIAEEHGATFCAGLAADGMKPFAVIGSACTTNTGTIDPLEKIAQISRKYDLWFHVDGAFGGSILVSDRYRHLLKGIENSDSISWDTHKWLLQTYSCSSIGVPRMTVRYTPQILSPILSRVLPTPGCMFSLFFCQVERTDATIAPRMMPMKPDVKVMSRVMSRPSRR